MALSARYRRMKQAVTRLRKSLLPRKFSVTGLYRNSHAVHIRAVSFRLLVHAEIEQFLEDRALELATAGLSAFKKSRVVTPVALGLVAFAGFETVKAPSKLGGDSTNQRAYEDYGVLIERANRAWRYELNNNHGVKETNVLALFLPLGINPADLDSTLLADLSSYGLSRGQAAHSSSVSVAKLADPKDELQKANQLISDLRVLDACVTSELSRVLRVTAAYH